MKKLRITVEGKAYEVTVELLEDTSSPLLQTPLRAPSPMQAPHATQTAAPTAAPTAAAATPAAGCTVVSCPMAGKVFKCLLQAGDQVAHNQVVIVLDAMKMETPVVAPVAGTVRTVLVKEGDSVNEGDSLFQIEPLPHG
jgi:biotin carboxyl carrier protein